jgi:hypothetical protein
LQKQGRKLFVFVHELFDVLLHLNSGMDDRPKMSGSDESKKSQDVLAAFAAKGTSQHIEGTLRLHRVHKDHSANGKQMVFDSGIWSRPINRPIHPLQATVNRFEVPSPRRRRLQKLDHLLNGLCPSRGEIRCGAQCSSGPDRNARGRQKAAL